MEEEDRIGRRLLGRRRQHNDVQRNHATLFRLPVFKDFQSTVPPVRCLRLTAEGPQLESRRIIGGPNLSKCTGQQQDSPRPTARYSPACLKYNLGMILSGMSRCPVELVYASLLA